MEKYYYSETQGYIGELTGVACYIKYHRYIVEISSGGRFIYITNQIKFLRDVNKAKLRGNFQV